MKFFILLGLLAFVSSSAWGQTEDYRRRKIKRTESAAARPAPPPAATVGMLRGKVVDAKTGETLPGATVVPLFPGHAPVVSDVDGQFVFSGLSPGNYSLEVRYISYGAKTVKDVAVKAGAVVPVYVALESEDAVELETVVIVESHAVGTDAALLSVQRNLKQISDGVSGQMILRESPDFQMTMALRRLPGVSLLENRFLNIRGTPERYNNFMLNSALLPNADVERAGFDFNALPSNILTSLRLIKSPSADLPGEFSGGMVQLETNDLPDRNAVRATVQLSYNTLSTFKDAYRYRYDGNFLGLFREVRGVPEDLTAQGTLQGAAPYSPERLAAARRIPNNVYPDIVMAPPALNVNFTLARRFKIADNDAGINIFASYNDVATNLDYIQYIVQGYDTALGRAPLADSGKYVLSNRVQTGTFMFNGGIRLGSSGKIVFHNMFNYSGDNVSGPGLGSYIFDGEWYDYYFHFQRFLSRKLYSGQIEGSHRFSDKAPTFKWRLNYSHGTASDPMMRALNYNHDPTIAADSLPDRNARQNDVLPGKQDRVYTLDLNQSIFSRILAHFSNEHILGGQIESVYAVGKWKKTQFHAGLFVNSRLKTFRSRSLALFPDFDSTGTPLYTFPIETVYLSNALRAYENIGDGGFTLYDYGDDYRNYDAQTHNLAPFLMADFAVAKRLNVNVGVRFDYFKREMQNYPVMGAKTPFYSFTQNAVLPSANLNYKIKERHNVRLSGGQTTVRPSDRDVAPFEFINFVQGIRSLGNSELVPTNVTNVDARYEFYPSGLELVSATLFYKHFDRPIEQSLKASEGGTNLNSQYYRSYNRRFAIAAGLEFETRLNAGKVFGVKSLEGLSAYANFTVLQSRLEKRPFQLFEPGRPLQGQAGYLVNFGVIYSAGRFSAAVFYNRVGKRIAVAGLGDQVFPNVWELPRDVMDVQAQYRFARHWTVKVSAVDVFNTPIRWVQDPKNSGSETFDRAKHNLIRYIRGGNTFFVSLTFDV